ncbi:MAG: hypothetical protein Q9165_007162 [Trypethelium subeluteriae]
MERSLKVDIREAEALLAEIAEEVQELLFLHPHADGSISASTPQRAAKLYDALVVWKLSLPPRLRSEDAVLPSAILLHVEVIIIALLRPFSLLTKAQFGPFNPSDRCHAHASSLQSAIWTFRAYANLRHEYWLCHVTVTVAFVTLREHEYSPAEMDTLIKACQCLHEMRETLPLAVDCLAAIHGAFRKLQLRLPIFVMRFFGVDIRHRNDGLMHHTIAALIPKEEVGKSVEAQELLLQQLLAEMDGVAID